MNEVASSLGHRFQLLEQVRACAWAWLAEAEEAEMCFSSEAESLALEEAVMAPSCVLDAAEIRLSAGEWAEVGVGDLFGEIQLVWKILEVDHLLIKIQFGS